VEVELRRGNPKIVCIYTYDMWVPHVITGLAGMRVRIAYFFAREQLSVGYNFVPASAPAGGEWRLYPRPSGFLPAGMQIFCTCCHL
jgi:hypothetical protein